MSALPALFRYKSWADEDLLAKAAKAEASADPSAHSAGAHRLHLH
jgi:hypothetical protein